jgi:preprotein translocase subunit SecG
MQVWYNLCVMLQILAAVVMIGLVLIQHGKGADMGASFGSGASGSLFGATGSANFLSRSTAVCATVFFAATLALSVLATHREPAAGGAPTSTVNRLDAALGQPGTASAASAAQAGAPASASAGASAAASSSAPAIPTK